MARDQEDLRVLVVDDDEGIATFVREALTDEGYAVDTAPNGAEALRLIAARRPDVPLVILLDMNMPVMDGPAFARAYRETPVPHAPILCVTADHDARRRCQEIEAAGYLGKPFDVVALLDKIDQLTRRAQ